ncbi:ATP-binding protein [Ferribacterium limneticum]|uniref:ATP-binding protein n=1 Tax=Ferribacterium limneticum TaxID=76259 RepID=UPI001CFA24E8|nr:ATP-binding protein [Ferribacterium limneticum]UCV17861.1 ATP-binding protein [Ferribacterium limneticum]
MQIQVRINEEGALRNQRYAFTDRFTLVSELLQNARRAGATHIEVDYDAGTQVLTIRDDGHGLDDFQKLLSFHESGWDAATSAEERPFGVGFSKCLYAATRCVVASGHQRVDIDTAAALAKASIDIESMADAVTGTRIDLHGVDLPDLGERIETLCLGFPVEVLFNGKPLMRRFAAAHLTTMDSPIGTVHLTGMQDGKFSYNTLVFLQGFCVMKPNYCPFDEVNVVHLDSRQFMARLPDRDKLIDEDVQSKRISTALTACWRQILESAKARLSPEQFVVIYYAAMRAWGHWDLLNDLDVLPVELFDEVVDYPIQDDDRSYIRQVAAAPTREAIESGAVTLVSLDWLGDDNAARWMLARAKGFLIFDWIGLSSDHWAWRHVRFLDNETVRVEAVSEQIRVQLEGRWIWPTVILCDSVILRSAKDVAEITEAGLCHEDVVYIPMGETSGQPVRQASSFIDENEQFMSSDLDADRDALADLIRRLRSVDPVQTLDSLLQELGLGKYPLLRGKTFAVTVGDGVAPGHSVALLAGTGDCHAVG